MTYIRRKPRVHGWTLVEHSAWGYKGDPAFVKGLESRMLITNAQAERVRSVGGVVFEDYVAAEDFAMEEMYPDNRMGFLPRAKGEFTKARIDGLRIYSPARRP